MQDPAQRLLAWNLLPAKRASWLGTRTPGLLSHLWHYPVTQPSLGLSFMTCQIKGQHDQFLCLSSHFGIIGLYAFHVRRGALIHMSSMTLPQANQNHKAQRRSSSGGISSVIIWGQCWRREWGLPGPWKHTPQVVLDLHKAKVLSQSPWVPAGPRTQLGIQI